MNREDWLTEVTQRLRPVFAGMGKPLPSSIRIAIGFTSHGRRGKAIGECWPVLASKDGAVEIMIKPDQDDALTVAAILAHELCHAADGNRHGHKAPFKQLAYGIGLEGKATATTAGPDFVKLWNQISEGLPPLPHGSLNSTMVNAKKQTTRLLKAECSECGYVVRLSKKWALSHGATCPIHGAMICDGVDDDGEGDDDGF